MIDAAVEDALFREFSKDRACWCSGIGVWSSEVGVAAPDGLSKLLRIGLPGNEPTNGELGRDPCGVVYL